MKVIEFLFKVNISFLKSIGVQSVLKRGIYRNPAKQSARFLQSPQARSENGGPFIFKLHIEIGGRDTPAKGVRATPYSFTPKARDFLQWGCCFLRSTATLPLDTLAS